MLFRLTGHQIQGRRQLTAPVPAHFASLHFLFANGSFNREIVFDPGIYFFPDEIAISLRAYTWGYDLFHPHRILGWHLYDRSTRITHWADHPEWKMMQEMSCRRLRTAARGHWFDNLISKAVQNVSGTSARNRADYRSLLMPVLSCLTCPCSHYSAASPATGFLNRSRRKLRLLTTELGVRNQAQA